MMKNKGWIAVLLVIGLMLAGCSQTGVGSNTEDSQSQIQSEEDDTQDVVADQDTQQESQEDEGGTETEEETQYVLYAQKNVNVRSIPDTSGERLGTLSVNEKIIGIGEPVDDWQKVYYNDTIAYVHSKYLGKLKVEATTQTQTPSGGRQQVAEITAEDLTLPEDFDPNGIVVVIDPGHQGVGNSEKEPDGPGSSTLKAKVTSGTSGVATGLDEYILNLQVALKLRDELKARGYQVVMIRENHEINISNSERAKFANNLGADAFIRIHANSTTNSSVHGAETICQTAANPYNADIYAECRKLSDCVLDEFVESTGAKKRYVWETDTMSGINWCEIPVTILEMGFMSNPEEDKLMASEDYQAKMVEGIANGIDKYFDR